MASLSLLVASALVASVAAYPYGAPAEACGLTSLADTGMFCTDEPTNTWTIQGVPAQYTDGNSYMLMVTGDMSFAGLLIWASAGKLVSDDPFVKVGPCEGLYSVTHNSPDLKAGVNLTWTAPSATSSPVSFGGFALTGRASSCQYSVLSASSASVPLIGKCSFLAAQRNCSICLQNGCNWCVDNALSTSCTETLPSEDITAGIVKCNMACNANDVPTSTSKRPQTTTTTTTTVAVSAVHKFDFPVLAAVVTVLILLCVCATIIAVVRYQNQKAVEQAHIQRRRQRAWQHRQRVYDYGYDETSLPAGRLRAMSAANQQQALDAAAQHEAAQHIQMQQA